MKRFNLFAILALLFLSVGACAQTTPKSTTAASGLTPKGTEVVQLDKESFKKLVFDFETLKEWKYSGTMPAILDFYADWCGPCKMLLPILDEIDFTDVLKVNVDELPEIAKRFGVMSIPTLIFFNNGLEQNREIGYRSLEEIKEEFKKL